MGRNLFLHLMKWILAVKGLKLTLDLFKNNLLTSNLPSVLTKRRIFTVLVENAVSLQLCDSPTSELTRQSLVLFTESRVCVCMCVSISVCVYLKWGCSGLGSTKALQHPFFPVITGHIRKRT